MERFSATYRIETAFSLDAAASAMAGEQSTGTFLKLESDDDPVVQRQAASVESVTCAVEVAGPSLPGAGVPSGGAQVWRQADVTLTWPLDTIGHSLPNLMATIAGNLFELRQLSGIRLRDVILPPSFLRAYQGPAFSVAGTRRLAGVERLPLIGTIVKPSVGLTPDATAMSVRTLIESGIDFKDDELQSPQGASAGVQSIRDAWDAALDGQELATRAASSQPLAAALAFFG